MPAYELVILISLNAEKQVLLWHSSSNPEVNNYICQMAHILQGPTSLIRREPWMTSSNADLQN